jgi:hypothetical protein
VIDQTSAQTNQDIEVIGISYSKVFKKRKSFEMLLFVKESYSLFALGFVSVISARLGGGTREGGEKKQEQQIRNAATEHFASRLVRRHHTQPG